ncbi:MAG: helix-turn-helix domain-containing protein, partial [Sphingorhabdus sp.]
MLLCLCDHAGEDGICWPAISRIVARTGIGERTVQRCLKWLADRQFFTTNNRLNRSRTYIINPRKLDTPANLTPRKSDTSRGANLTPHPRKSDTQIDKEPV